MGKGKQKCIHVVEVDGCLFVCGGVERFSVGGPGRLGGWDGCV